MFWAVYMYVTYCSCTCKTRLELALHVAYRSSKNKKMLSELVWMFRNLQANVLQPVKELLVFRVPPLLNQYSWVSFHNIKNIALFSIQYTVYNIL